MLIIEFTKTYGDVGQVEILRNFHPCLGNIGEWTLPVPLNVLSKGTVRKTPPFYAGSSLTKCKRLILWCLLNF